MVLITIVTGANLNQLITGGDHIAVMGGLWHFFTHNRYYLSTRSLAAPRSIQRHREDVDGHGGRPTERCLRGGPRLFQKSDENTVVSMIFYGFFHGIPIFLDMVDLVSQCFNGLVQGKIAGKPLLFFLTSMVDRVFCRCFQFWESCGSFKPCKKRTGRHWGMFADSKPHAIRLHLDSLGCLRWGT